MLQVIQIGYSPHKCVWLIIWTFTKGIYAKMHFNPSVPDDPTPYFVLIAVFLIISASIVSNFTECITYGLSGNSVSSVDIFASGCFCLTCCKVRFHLIEESYRPIPLATSFVHCGGMCWCMLSCVVCLFICILYMCQYFSFYYGVSL